MAGYFTQEKMKISKLPYNFLAFLISFNLIFSSFYPILIYAQDEDEYSYPYPYPYPTPEYDYPTPYEYPTPFEPPADEPQSEDTGETSDFDNYSENVEEAETQEPETPQETDQPEEIPSPPLPETPEWIEQEQQEITQEPVEPVDEPEPEPIFDQISQESAIEYYEDNTQEITQQYQEEQAQQREEQSEDLQNISNTISEIPDNVGNVAENLGDAIEGQITNLTEDRVEEIHLQNVDEGISQGFEEISNQSQKEYEVLQNQINSTLFAPEAERSQNIAEVLNITEGSTPQEVALSLEELAENAGIQFSGDLNSFEISYSIPLFSFFQGELTSEEPPLETGPVTPVEAIEQENSQLQNLIEFGKELGLSTVTLGGYDWYKFTTESLNQIVSDTEKLDQLNEARKADTRLDAALRLTDEYFNLTRMSDEEVSSLANRLVEDYGFESLDAVSTQLFAERDSRNLAHDIRIRQESLGLEVTANAAMTAVGFIPGAGPAKGAAGAALREVNQLLPPPKSFVDKFGDAAGGIWNFTLGRFFGGADETAQVVVRQGDQPVFVGQLQEALQGGVDRDLSILYSVPFSSRATDAQVEEVAYQIFGKVDDETFATVSYWFYKEISPETVERALTEATRIKNSDERIRQFILENTRPGVDKVVLSEELQQVSRESNQSLRHALDQIKWEKGEILLPFDVELDKVFEYPSLIDALVRYQQNRKILEPIIEEQKVIFDGLERLVQTNLDPDFKIAKLDQVLNPERIYIVPNIEGQNIYGPLAGRYVPFGDTVLIRADLIQEFKVGVCAHECSHRAQHIQDLGHQNNMVYDLADERISAYEGYRRITEGVTEFTKQIGEREAGTNSYPSYEKEVSMIWDSIIPGIMDNLGVSREYAEAVVVRTGVTGDYKSMIEAAGGVSNVRNIVSSVIIPEVKTDITSSVNASDALVAKNAVAEIINTRSLTPPTSTVVQTSPPPPQPSNPFEAVLDVLNDGATAVRETAVNTYNTVVETAPQIPGAIVNTAGGAKDAVGNFFGGLFGGQVKGVSTSNAFAADINAFELLTKQQLIKQKLQQEGKVNSTYVREILRSEVIQPSFTDLGGGYEFTTGKSGISNGEIKGGKYVVRIGGIKGVDIIVPSVIEINGGNVIIPVAVKQGKGNIKRIKYKSSSLVKEAFAQEEATSSATLTVFADENDNGKLDKNESVLPWSGVNATLQNVDQTRVVSLLEGWNLITLTSLPNEPLTASGLLKAIAQDGGYATTVSTLENGNWKSFVQRGNESFSGDDFVIVPGKAYFVKALKRSAFLFKGQVFIEGVKISLDSGWNAVGFPQTSKEYKIEDIISQTNSDSASRWESGLWDSFVKQDGNKYGENFPIEPNRGYILKANGRKDFIP